MIKYKLNQDDMLGKVNVSNLLTKELVKKVKEQGDVSLSSFVNEHSNNIGDLVFILENLGHLPTSYDMQWGIPLLSHKNEEVRFLVVKNIGKLKSEEYLNTLYQVANHDNSSKVKREAVSSVGRIRSKKSIPFLQDMLRNEDPKIVCQAIRGLLVFKGDDIVDKILQKLISHENEMVRTVIYA